MPPHPDLYVQDLYAWTREQARLLDTHQFEALDIPHLIEEVISLGKSEQRELYTRLSLLLTPLLTLHLAVLYRLHDLQRAGRGWWATVKTQRSVIFLPVGHG